MCIVVLFLNAGGHFKGCQYHYKRGNALMAMVGGLYNNHKKAVRCNEYTE